MIYLTEKRYINIVLLSTSYSNLKYPVLKVYKRSVLNKRTNTITSVAFNQEL